jgi:glycosyltransferase involved in cell wall biosynthesis
MKASIVINNYNYARFLSQAIESALAQTHRNTEVIVIDDGSTDRSAEIIRSYGDRIVAVFKSNGGQSSCYYRGYEVASGDLVLFLDADDYLYPHCISEVVNHWKEGCVKAHFYLEVVDQDGRRIDGVVPSGRLSHGNNPLKMMHLFGAYCSPPASGNVYSRDFLSQILPRQRSEEFRRFEAIHFGGDSVPILAAPYFGRIEAIPQLLGVYRRHANAAEGVMSVFQAEASVRILERAYQKDLIRDRAWRLVAGETQTPKFSEPSRLKRHICYLRLVGRGLDAADSRLALAAKGVISSIWWDGYSWKQKLAAAGWFVGMAILPSKITKILIPAALGISDRAPHLKKFLQARRTVNSRPKQRASRGDDRPSEAHTYNDV